MPAQLKNAGWSIYGISCLIFWFWFLHPHAIPQSQLGAQMYIVFGGGGFCFFGFFGAILNEKLFADPDAGVFEAGYLYAIAAVIAGLLQYLYRGIPHSAGDWTRIIIAFLSIAAALYLLARDAALLLVRWQQRVPE